MPPTLIFEIVYKIAALKGRLIGRFFIHRASQSPLQGSPRLPPKLSQDLPKVRQRLFWVWLGPGAELEGFWGGSALSSTTPAHQIKLLGTLHRIYRIKRILRKRWQQMHTTQTCNTNAHNTHAHTSQLG